MIGDTVERQRTAVLNNKVHGSASPTTSNLSEQTEQHGPVLEKSLGMTASIDLLNMIPTHVIKAEKDHNIDRSSVVVDQRENGPIERKNQSDFETSMKNKLNALTSSIKSNELENTPQYTLNGYIAEKTKVHINGYVIDTNKKLDFLTTDDSTIGYESDMSASGQAVVETKAMNNDSDLQVQELKTENVTSRPNGITAGHQMMTLTSLLTGSSLSTGNGMTSGNNFITGSDMKSGRYRTNNAVAGRALLGLHPIVAQWDSLRERSRKYKLAR